MKILIIFYLLLISSISYADNSIDIIVVNKSERILYVVKNDKIIKKYEIALGLNPMGHKKKKVIKKHQKDIILLMEKILIVNTFYHFIPHIQIFMINRFP